MEGSGSRTLLNLSEDSAQAPAPAPSTIRSKYGVRAAVAGLACIGAAVFLLSSRSGPSAPVHSKPSALRKLGNPSCAGDRLLTFDHSNVLVNNLGNHGPLGKQSEASIVYSNVLPASGRRVNLRVHVDTPPNSGWTHTYVPDQSFLNGLALPVGDRQDSNTRYGQINLRAGTEVNLRFEFVDGVTSAPVTVESFFFSFFHMTAGPGGSSRMQVSTEGVGQYHLSDDTKMRVSTVGYGEIEVQQKTSTFETNPMYSSASDMSRAVTFAIPKGSEFALTLHVTQGSEAKSFQFSGPSALVCGAATPT